MTFQKGQIAWNKGTKGLIKANSGSFKKGNKVQHSEITKQKQREARLKNPIKYWLGKKRPPCSEETKKKIGDGNRGKTQTEETKIKIQKAHTGDKNYLWKGNKVGYRALHTWIKKWKGEPETCESCGKTGLKTRQIHWANIDHKYRRILDDYIRLCVRCHKEFDKKNV